MTDSAAKPGTTLELDDDPRFQRRMWVFERAAWGAMTLLILAAGLGLFSQGVLSRATVADAAGNVQVSYQRFERHEARSTLRIDVTGPGGGATVVLGFEQDYTDRIGIEAVQPEPERWASRDGLLWLTFAPAAGPLRIDVKIRPQRAGTAHGSVRVGDGAPIAFSQFVYP